MAPDAVEIAATLRLAGRAWLVGESLRTEVAESRWQGVGDAGIAYRWEDLVSGGQRWPDEIPADRRMAEPRCIALELSALGMPAALVPGPGDRPPLQMVDSFGKKQPAMISLGIGRAALIVSHGAARTFFPYFNTVGDTIDERLEETLGTLGTALPERKQVKNLLRRFGNALNDGHSLAFDYGSGSLGGSFPVWTEVINGEPVVRRSIAVGVNAGDTITSIGGIPADQFYATELARTSAATYGYRFEVATREYMRLKVDTEFGLRDADGGTRIIVFQPQPVSDILLLGLCPTLRPAGWLTDLGAPNLYYINMAGEVLYDTNDFLIALTEAEPAAGLVIDMRGFPGVDLVEVLTRLIPAPFSAPIMRVPVLTGPDDRSIDETFDSFDPQTGPSYTGPIVLLVAPGTLSAAEHFSLTLVDAGRVKVIGRRSAATDGNITGVQLPGSFALSFTGMDVRHHDAQKSVFHGVGIVPEGAETVLSAVQFRDGVDQELNEAISWLLMNP
jgi:hypothetical protein